MKNLFLVLALFLISLTGADAALTKLKEVRSVNGYTGAVSLTKADVGLSKAAYSLDTSFSTVAATADDVETELFSYAMPADTVDVNGQVLRVDLWLVLGGSGVNTRIKFKIGAQTAFDLGTGSLSSFSTSSVRVTFECVRITSTSQKCTVDSSIASVFDMTTTTVNLANALDVKITGYGTNTNDTVKEYVKVSLIP